VEQLSADVRARFARVRLLLCDVDGVLTDATVSIGNGIELKRFCVRDGLAHRFLRDCGIQVGWVSNRPSPATTQRAAELQVDYLYQDRQNKVQAVERILAQAGVAWGDVCYMGDDVVDLGVLRRAGLAVSVANGIPEAKALAHYVTETAGGQGAVREVVDLLLQAQGRWEALILSYAS
jgi:3-deoxy-D-manno-octulosonate 8-phosphate phosphatase (KDO 8-P phosphatase)